MQDLRLAREVIRTAIFGWIKVRDGVISPFGWLAEH
jgi:hypothetical protein